ncbi:MAG: hypothetical protein QCH99_09760 [Candidatus Bathyarchaeota archaeon]|nr:hypothetical protein [Candidatus Bathyarchaeum tardum]
MSSWKPWIVATKDFSVFRKNKYIFYSLVTMPLLFGLVLPLSFLLFLPAEVPMNEISLLLDMFTTYFAMLAAIIPSFIASYSFVGEKVEKSLEPLLATPTTDGELLLGKSIAAFLPSMVATYIGALAYLVVVNTWSYINLNVFLLPDLHWVLIVGLVAPLACILSVESNVIISSKVSDVRAAQQLGAIVVLPIIIVLVFAPLIPAVSSSVLALVLSGILSVPVIALYYLSKATFNREKILTKWK